MNLAFTSKTPTASDGEISKITFLNLQREEEGEVSKAAVIGCVTVPEQNPLVGLKILDGDQHALLVEPRGRVLLRNLLALLRFAISGFL